MNITRRRAFGLGMTGLAAASLIACGQKSALYLPQKKKVKVPPDPNNPEGTAPGSPAGEPAASPDTAPSTAPPSPPTA